MLVYGLCRPLLKSAKTHGTDYNGDQMLDFSVLELVRSQSKFSIDPEVLQNCAGFTLCSSAVEYSVVMV